jgi:hypothetical protein
VIAHDEELAVAIFQVWFFGSAGTVGWPCTRYGSSSLRPVDEDVAVVDVDRVAPDADHALDEGRTRGVAPSPAGGSKMTMSPRW